jgi:hypothetical protein
MIGGVPILGQLESSKKLQGVLLVFIAQHLAMTAIVLSVIC